MKNSIKIALLSICAVVLVSCGDKFLTQDPYGSTITQEQFSKLSNQLEGSMRGIYSMMYTVTDHDEFGKRSIDMYCDLLSGDMALTNYNYGWFYTDERGLSATYRNGYIWAYYYGMLRNVNSVIASAQATGDANTNVITRINKNGLPNKLGKDANKNDTYFNIVGADTLDTFTEDEASIAYFYAQALAMRGYIYSNLVMLFCETPRNIKDFKTELCFPMYNETNMEAAQGMAVMSDVYKQIESDLTSAIQYLEAFHGITRNSKLEIDANVARGILAYSYLNKGNTVNTASEMSRNAYAKALQYAGEAIQGTDCMILPIRDLCETGFNDVNNVSWMWAQDVTTETAGGLASWFGQCDIHSYSYAWSGDTKAIDENLYKLIADADTTSAGEFKGHPFDARINWFNDGKQNATYKYCPDGKFYSAKARKSTKADDIDREWLSDNVFMRIESMYLIAAEAAYRLTKYDSAAIFLTAITDERVLSGMDSLYTVYKTGLNSTNLLQEIEYNWRVELWGEGYALMTFRRLGPEILAKTERRRGANHASSGGSKIEAGGSQYIYVIPSSESSYNPKIGTTTL